jgi:quercetin dioxygenase-like cupin family protein
LIGLVEVAEGSIVSRVLAKSDGCNVTLFAFDRGQGLSEHTAPFDALVQVVDGALDLRIGEVSVTVETGEIVRMPAHVPHALHAPVASRMVLTMLRDHSNDEE